MKTISEMGNVVYNYIWWGEKIKPFPWVSLKCQQNTFPGGKLSPTQVETLNSKESKILLLHHSSGILVSPNHCGGSNPEPPDKVPENSFILQDTYTHIIPIKMKTERYTNL